MRAVAQLRWVRIRFFRLIATIVLSSLSSPGWSQPASNSRPTIAPHAARARRFLAGRLYAADTSAAQAISQARQQHLSLLARPADLSQSSNLTTPWQAVGPNQVASESYGNVTGRVTTIAIDPSDTSGNTVYIGTTGGGVWKSTNAAGPPADVTFSPLTDTLPVFSESAGSSAIPSLSIGAISVQAGVILAGTGDTNDASDSYYGGGLLRSADGGVTWTLIQNSDDGVAGHHSFVGLGFAGFAWSTTTPGLVVAAVSQAAQASLVNAVSNGNSVMGLYYSTDYGVTWQMSTIMDGGQLVQSPTHLSSYAPGRAVTAVVWNPYRQRFYATVRYHGYYESPDGANWTRLANQPGSGLTTTACPAAPTSAGSSACPIFRGALAVQPNTGDMFALSIDSNNLDQGLWQDLCSLSSGNCGNGTVTFATQLPSSPLEAGNGSTAILQGDYNLVLAAVPFSSGSTQDTLLFVGTIDIYRCSLSAGCTLRNTTNSLNGCAAPARVAPDQHAIAALSAANQPLIYFGNDGGVWRSTDGVNQQASPCSSDDANHYQNLNGGLGSLAEVVSFAQSPTDTGTLLAGLGANGTAATSAALSAPGPWPQLSNAEGGPVAIDPSNPQLWYISTGAGVSIHPCSQGAACSAADFSGMPAIGAAQVAEDDSLIDAPWMLDPELTSDVLIGTCRVWRGPASSGSSWSSSNAISKLLAGPQNASCAGSNPVVRSLVAAGPAGLASAAQNAGSSVLYAGMAGMLDGGGSAGGHLFSMAAANTATNQTMWSDVTASPVSNNPSGFNAGGFDISSIAADPHDATGATVYVTIMGFSGNGINANHIYRSVDAGAHWTDVSSNLPNAPANSVIVDPNDANTLYVALDTGVYVTTNVTSCPSENCWNVYGSGLPNAPVVQLSAAVDLPTGDGRTGELRAATYGRGIWQIPLLTAATGVAPAITLAPGALNFASQAVGTASAAQTITVTNTGSAALTISSITETGDFSETGNCIGSSIAVGSDCTVQVLFLPTATGSRTGVLTIYGNIPGGQATASLSGSATAGSSVVLTPVVLNFPSTTVNASSPPQNITISNTGSTSIALQTPVVSGPDFTLSANTCGASLAAGTGCTVAIVFTPKTAGARNGTLTITDAAGTQTAQLSGTATSPPTDSLSPLSLTFGSQQIDTASGSQQVILTNSGDQALTLIAAQITGGNFTVVNACGNSLNGHSICAINVAFAPTNVGSLTGVLTISDQFRTQTVALTGFGIAPPGVSLAPFGALNFPSTGVGLTSAGQTVTLTNNGGGPLQIQSMAVSGDFVIVPGGTCGVTLAVGAACTMQIASHPGVAGPCTGTLTVIDNGPDSPQMLGLNGAGMDFTLTSNGPSDITISSGQNAVFPLLLSSSANVFGTVAFVCTGMPANSTCNITPSTVALGGTTTVSLTVLTGVQSSSRTWPPSPARSLLWFAVLLPFTLFGMRSGRLSRLSSLVLLGTLMVVSGCGSGRAIPAEDGSSPTTGPVTSSGTYTVAASASSAGLIRSVNLTLVVQ